jgi:hypothetical protein
MTIEGGLSGFPVVWHEDCLLHDPGGEVWLGQRDEGTEVPDRARVILAARIVQQAVLVPHNGKPAQATLDGHQPRPFVACSRGEASEWTGHPRA